MRKLAKRTAFPPALALVLVLFSPVLRADDFAFHEIGARAAALGGAFTGKADDVTALFYNPAGLAFLGGFRVKTNLAFSERTLDASWPGTGRAFASDPREFLAGVFMAWRPARGIALGTGFFSPYGFKSAWPRLWSGDEVSINAKLQSRFFRFALAVEPVKGLALGAALDLVSLSAGWDHLEPFEPENYALPQPVYVISNHSASGHGTGFTASVLWKAFSWFQVGARYQKSAAVSLSGFNRFVVPTDFMTMGVTDPDSHLIQLWDLFDKFYTRQDVTSELTLPEEIAAGIVLRPFARISLALDVQWTRWSDFGRWEFRSIKADEDLSPEFTPAYQEYYGIAPNYGTQGYDLAVGDARRLKAGLEYQVGRWFAFRAGYTRHESSVVTGGRTPLYPDPSFEVYSFGAGYEGPVYSIWDEETVLGYLTIDVFASYASAPGSVSELPGLELTYSARRWIAGVGVGFTF